MIIALGWRIVFVFRGNIMLEVEQILASKGFKLNPEVATLEDVAEYIDMVNDVDVTYTVSMWVEDTLSQYKEYVIPIEK